jgi:hypothetical protein
MCFFKWGKTCTFFPTHKGHITIYDGYLTGLDRTVILSHLRFHIRILLAFAFKRVMSSAAFVLQIASNKYFHENTASESYLNNPLEIMVE